MSITVRGLDRLYKKLGKVKATKTLVPPMHKATLRLESEMKEYPPQRPGSKYIRGYGYPGGPRTSENLGKRWTTRVKRTTNGVTGKVGNNASYAALVQSERFQARIHRGRWQTDRDVLKEQTSKIERDFQSAINRALAG